MIAAIAWLKGRLARKEARRSHRVTTITRTVTREKGEPQEQEVKREEEIIIPEPRNENASQVSIAVISVAATVAAAFVLGWLIRHLR